MGMLGMIVDPDSFSTSLRRYDGCEQTFGSSTGVDRGVAGKSLQQSPARTMNAISYLWPMVGSSQMLILQVFTKSAIPELLFVGVSVCFTFNYDFSTECLCVCLN